MAAVGVSPAGAIEEGAGEAAGGLEPVGWWLVAGFQRPSVLVACRWSSDGEEEEADWWQLEVRLRKREVERS